MTNPAALIKPGDLHWYSIGEDGVPELYLDNNMMHTFRMCEQRAVHEFIEGFSGSGRVWFLDYGTVVHKLIEIYYQKRRDADFSIHEWATTTTARVWAAYKMQHYVEIQHKDCETAGGLYGLMGMLAQYANTYNSDNERFRIIGTELYFGKNKEVLLGDIIDPFSNSVVCRLYLSGKIDLLVDNGVSIGPMDHKTSKNFMGRNPGTQFEVHEGMEGYVFAARALLAKHQAQNQHSSVDSTTQNISRRCNTIWMNCMQVKPDEDASKRFKRINIMYTDEMLEDYRQRMLRTGFKIFTLLQSPDPVFAADRNTDVCTNWYHNICAFQSAHRQKGRIELYKILNADFVKKPVWNPENRDDEIEL